MVVPYPSAGESRSFDAPRPQQLDDLIEALAREPRDREKLFLPTQGGSTIGLSGPDLVASARSFLELATSYDLRRGDRVLVEMEPRTGSVAAILGCLLGGLIAVPVPPRSAHGASEERHSSRMTAIESVAGATAVARHDSLSGGPLLERLAEPEGDFQELIDSEIAVLQFTSGSSSSPRGCALTMEAISSQVRRLRLAYTIESSDVGTSWLPLFHDMGLFGSLLMPLSAPGMQVHLSETSSFVRDPRSWLHTMERLGATVSVVPASALIVLCRLLEGRRRSFDLRSLRCLIVGAEPVRVADAVKAQSSLHDSGARLNCIRPSYGLAEAVLHVTSAEGVSVMNGSRAGNDISDASSDQVSVGTFDPREVKLDPSNSEVLVRTPSLMTGYWTSDGLDRTAFTNDGWLRTGDVGRDHDGELVIVGRLSNTLVLVGGRNVYAEDVEAFVRTIFGDSRVTVVAVPQPGHDVVAEHFSLAIERRSHVSSTVDGIPAKVLETFGVKVSHMETFQPGKLQRTSSGKVDRPGVAKQMTMRRAAAAH